MTQVWRVLKRRHSADAFTGEGARLHGGRWNSRGVRVVYTAGSAALAALEILVHTEDRSALDGYVAYALDVPEDAIETLDPGVLPDGWDAYPAPAATRSIGDAWVQSGRTLGLRVPSAIVPGSNVLLNPAHAAFRKLAIPKPRDFRLDDRLKR